MLDQYTFKDLRGGQKGTGPEQTLVLLASQGKQGEVVSTLETITPAFPLQLIRREGLGI